MQRYLRARRATCVITNNVRKLNLDLGAMHIILQSTRMRAPRNPVVHLGVWSMCCVVPDLAVLVGKVECSTSAI